MLRCASDDALPRVRAYLVAQLVFGLTVAAILAGFGAGIASVMATASIPGVEHSSTIGAAPLITALAFLPLVEAVRMPLVAELERRMRFGFLAKIEVCATALQVLTWFVLATQGAGPWALIAGVYAAAGLRTACVGLSALPLLRGVRARACDYASLRRFGTPMWMMLLLSTVFWIGKDVLAGALLGVAAAGFFGMAYEIPRAILHVAESWNRVGLALLGQSSVERRRRVASFNLRASGAILGPVAVLGMLHPEFCLRVAFGARWVEAAPVFRVFMLLAACEGTLRVWTDIATTQGRPELPMRASAVTVLLLPLFAIVALPYGIEGLSYAILAAWFAPLPFCIAWAQRCLQLSFLSALLPALGAIAASVACGVVCRSLFAPLPVAAEAAVIGSEALTFAFVLLISDRELARVVRESLARRRLAES